MVIYQWRKVIYIMVNQAFLTLNLEYYYYSYFVSFLTSNDSLNSEVFVNV